MIPNRLSPEPCDCEDWLDDAEVALERVVDAVDVRTGLAFSVVDAIAEEGLVESEVESDVSVDGMV
jgi:hypothetical protein